MTNSIKLKIATILEEIGNKKCLEKCKELKQISSNTNTLNLRDLDLNTANAIAISNCLKNTANTNYFESITFSYNTKIGDDGVIALINSYPKSIKQIGIVNCGFSDPGGIEILKRLKQFPDLNMICMEQNNFSKALKQEFQVFSNTQPQLIFVF